MAVAGYVLLRLFIYHRSVTVTDNNDWCLQRIRVADTKLVQLLNTEINTDANNHERKNSGSTQ